MKSAREHPVRLTVVALALAAVAVVAIASASGWRAFGDSWSHLQVGWLALVASGQLLAIPAYLLAYRKTAKVDGGPELNHRLVTRVVISGFGAFATGGGFALDKRALHAVEDNERAATVRVLGLGALEWAVLAPAAWVSAVALLAAGDPRAMPSLLWPWAIAVPCGFALGFWMAVPARRKKITADGKRWRVLDHALRAVAILRQLAACFSTCWGAWIGMALYWAFDIASFYGASRFIGVRLNIGEAILAYATGYALTRRSMPLGGAGITEALLTFSLHWVGQPIAASLATVVAYRVFNFLLPTIPALFVRPRVKPLLDAADQGRTPASRERRRADEPLLAMRRRA